MAVKNVKKMLMLAGFSLLVSVNGFAEEQATTA